MTDTDQFLGIDSLIRSGQLSQAQELLSTTNFSKIPRAQMARWAQLTRRAGLFEMGLRLLGPIVRPRNRLKTDPSPWEIAEYAVLLSRIGSLREAQHLLEQPTVADLDETLLYRAFILFNQWQYQEAMPLLLKFISKPGISSYQKLTGQVNLLAAAAYLNDEPCMSEWLEPTIQELSQGNHHRLLANIFELSCGWNFRKGDQQRARSFLDKSKGLLTGIGNLDSLYIQKWEVILSCFQTGQAGPLYTFKELARQEGWSEVERDADYHHLIIQFAPDRADYLFGGTPFSSYRDRMVKQFSQNADWQPPTEFYQWGKEGGILDLSEMTWQGQNIFKKNSLQHRLLKVLAADFYSQQTVGALFANLYPREYFAIDSSTVKVHQLVARTRRELEQLQIPLTIESKARGYKLVKGQVILRLPAIAETRATTSKIDDHYLALSKNFQSSYFKTEEAASAIGLSRSSVLRALSDLMSAGRLESLGKGRGKIWRLL